jgi:NAD-dependent dihydropyrimidine dehydrogenase PreA subunit
MDVQVQVEKCTGCRHCFDVCPVNVFVMHPRAGIPNVVDDPGVAAKFRFRSEKSIAEHGPDCILCNACLTECEGSCITIWDDEGTTYQSTYK